MVTVSSHDVVQSQTLYVYLFSLMRVSYPDPHSGLALERQEYQAKSTKPEEPHYVHCSFAVLFVIFLGQDFFFAALLSNSLNILHVILYLEMSSQRAKAVTKVSTWIV